MANVANVIAGPGALFIAPKGTALPGLSASLTTFGGFTPVGYTDDGVELDYTPTIKDIMVDEESTAVQVLLTTEKLVVTVKLAETTLANLFNSIAGATLTGNQLTIGGLFIPNEFAMGIAGPAPSTGKIRQIGIHRVIQKAGVKMHYQRKDKVMFACQFEALADSTQPIGARMCVIQDF